MESPDGLKGSTYRVPSAPDRGPGRSRRAPGRRGGAWALALALALGCTDPVPEEGPLRGILVSPNGVEGAALFELPADGVIAVSAPLGIVLEHRAGALLQVAVVLSRPDTIRLDLSVADRIHPPDIRVLQVSGPDDQPRALSGYRVRVEVPR